jgi:hypothetical protein
MLHPSEGPFLGEAEVPHGTALGPGEGADVLHHARFLVVGLLDQEAVVGDVDGLRSQGGGQDENRVKREKSVKREA